MSMDNYPMLSFGSTWDSEALERMALPSYEDATASVNIGLNSFV